MIHGLFIGSEAALLHGIKYALTNVSQIMYAENEKELQRITKELRSRGWRLFAFSRYETELKTLQEYDKH